MDIEDFERLAKKEGLDGHLDRLHKVRRRAVDVELMGSTSREVRSRFGGSPDLPSAMKWPEHHLGPYAFLGQIDFAEVAAAYGGSKSEPFAELGFPPDGLVSLLHAYDLESSQGSPPLRIPSSSSS